MTNKDFNSFEWLINTKDQSSEERMETKVINHSFEPAARKRRRVAENPASHHHLTAISKSSKKGPLGVACPTSVFNEHHLPILNSLPESEQDNASSSNASVQKPRSHANARERDRTHRCVAQQF